MCKIEISLTKKFGGAGHRSPYLSHAKRALYHLSYTPDTFNESGIDEYFKSKMFKENNLPRWEL